MSTLSLEKLLAYRANTYHLHPSQRLTDLQSAVKFVNERGFVYFWPIKDIELPSLWAAVAGLRPVADAHDDPGHITWGWKDESLSLRLWYYGKILRKRATLVDLEIAPYFYALSNNYGDPADDVLIQYHEGHLTQEAKIIFETLLENGPMDTIALRKATRMISKDSNARFERALVLLQSDFKVLPIGISDAGGWRYAFIYELTHRFYPDLPERARSITEPQAYQMILRLYFRSVGAAQFRDLTRLFHWRPETIHTTISQLIRSGEITGGWQHPDLSGELFVSAALLD